MKKTIPIFLLVIIFFQEAYGNEKYIKEVRGKKISSEILGFGDCIETSEYDLMAEKRVPKVKISYTSCEKNIVYKKQCDEVKWWFDSCEKIKGSERVIAKKVDGVKVFAPSYFENTQNSYRNEASDGESTVERIGRELGEVLLEGMSQTLQLRELMADCRLFKETAYKQAHRNKGKCEAIN